jgi:beta-glucosidase
MASGTNNEHVEARIDALLRELTLPEKVAMAAGSGLWFSTGVPRLGIPAYKVSDGPNGVRGEGAARMTAASFPVGTAMAATWNRELIGAVGAALAEECVTKGVQVLLGPTVNIHRSPLAGRNFEGYSEDPYLSAEIACALISNVQRAGIACCIKHFVANDSEFQRQSISSDVDERTLREIYLYPFEQAVRRSKVWSVMSAYNRVNGEYASANARLLRGVLKDEWEFDGVVISDWGGTYDTVGPANAGLDLEMPGPAQHMGDKLLKAVQAGAVSEAVIDDKVRRHLRLLLRTAALDAAAPPPERSLDRPEHRALIRRVAAEGIVLLKNDGMLPLADVRRIALLGPNAVEPQVLGGGSSAFQPHYIVDPAAGIAARWPHARLTVARGAVNFKHLPLLPARQCRVPNSDRAGLEISFYNAANCAGEPALVTHPRRSELLWFGRFSPQVDDTFSARVVTEFLPSATGEHRFSLMSAGVARLFVDGDLVVDNWTSQRPGDSFFGSGSDEVVGAVQLTEGETATLTVEYRRENASSMAGLRIGMAPPTLVDDIDHASALAADADVAVVIVGLTGEWESEGHDRRDLELPGAQVALIRAVAWANPNTVVVVNAGSPIRMGDWLEAPRAVLQVWYPGQEFGNALADVLSGVVNPSGRLPMTIPMRLQDNPAFTNYPGERGHVRYGEGIFVGYRYYDHKQIEPQFPFGYGLSYTTFDYADLHTGRPRYSGEEDVVVTVTVRNTGSRSGQEVVQLYVSDPVASVQRPPRELKSFFKVELDVGESKQVQFRLQTRDFAFYDVAKPGWTVEPGEYLLAVGGSSRDLRQSIAIVRD